MKIALIRHGKTMGNLRHAFVGKLDQPLCEQGVRELHSLVGYPRVQLILTSPRLRCVQTADILYPGQEPIVVDELRERDFGSFEGKTHEQIIKLPGFADWGMNAQGMIFPDGEPFAAFSQRCMSAFSECLRHAREKRAETAAVICHGGVIMALMERLALPHRDYFMWHCPTGGGYLLDCTAHSDTVAAEPLALRVKGSALPAVRRDLT